jgi:hypothetical protein
MTQVAHTSLNGHTVNSLQVLKVARRFPELAWECVCLVCGVAGQTHNHRDLMNSKAKCKRAGCNVAIRKESTPLSEYQQERRAERQTKEAAEAAKREAEAKRQRETERQSMLTPIRAEWHQYVMEAMNKGVRPEGIISLDEWIKADPGVRKQYGVYADHQSRFEGSEIMSFSRFARQPESVRDRIMSAVQRVKQKEGGF